MGGEGGIIALYGDSWIQTCLLLSCVSCNWPLRDDPLIPRHSDMCAVAAADAGMRDAIAPRLLAFWRFFQAQGGAAYSALSVRDLLAWVAFVTASAPAIGLLAAYAHGAHLVLLDGIGLGLGMAAQVALPPAPPPRGAGPCRNPVL